MNERVFQSFGDELVKIAFFRKIRGGLVQALSEGWHGTPEQIARGEGQTWFGQGRKLRPGMSRGSRMLEEATSLGGATKALPIGGKSMMMLGTGLMARDALRPQDPSGRDRSRTERMVGLAGNTAGGLVGSALLARAVPRSAFLAPLVGGIAGGMFGEKVMTAPWAHHRPAPQQPAPQPQPVQPNPGVVA